MDAGPELICWRAMVYVRPCVRKFARFTDRLREHPMKARHSIQFLIGAAFMAATMPLAAAQDAPVQFTVHWDKVIASSKTMPTLQVVVNPPLRRGTAVHDNAFQALHDLGADYVRYVPWLPYPRLGVAELESPKDGKTSWDFSLIDPITVDFLEPTKSHPQVLNYST